ncbi:GNAT family N-acetyltransferase [Chloroflexia bacterium SDU3-3]|nr:GNAT family N-acetyltransferase [Chloroflexia bacterium SDU3-3]
MPHVALQEINADNWRATLDLAVHPQQQAFIAGHTPIAALVLAKAYVRPGGLRWVPYAIATDQVFVGMLALAYEPGSSETYWLYHFFIDQRHQGQGYGAAALGALFAHIRREHPLCRRLHLTVHPDNHSAQRLYRRLGFAPAGQQIHGEPHYQRAM